MFWNGLPTPKGLPVSSSGLFPCSVSWAVVDLGAQVRPEAALSWRGGNATTSNGRRQLHGTGRERPLTDRVVRGRSYCSASGDGGTETVVASLPRLSSRLITQVRSPPGAPSRAGRTRTPRWTSRVLRSALRRDRRTWPGPNGLAAPAAVPAEVLPAVEFLDGWRLRPSDPGHGRSAYGTRACSSRHGPQADCTRPGPVPCSTTSITRMPAL